MTREAGFSREWSLVLECAKARAHGKTIRGGDRVLDCAGPVDWHTFAELADAQGMSAIAADALHGSALHSMALHEPDALELRQQSGDNAKRAFQYAHELARLAERFRSRDIGVVFYKGPVLAQLAYGNIALRDYADLDLLIEPAALADASALLEECGYTQGYALTRGQRTAFTRTDGDYPFYGDGNNGMLVELHCRVSSERFGVRLDSSTLLRDAIDVDMFGTSVRTLAHIDHALVLCVHGCKHEWQRLEWLVALVALLRSCNLDLEDLLQRANVAHARRNVLLSFGLAERLLDLQLTPAIAHVLAADAELKMLVTRAAQNLIAGTTPSTGARMLFNLQAKDSVLDRLKFTYRWLALPTPEDWKAIHITDTFAPLYRLVRPLRLAARSLRRAS